MRSGALGDLDRQNWGCWQQDWWYGRSRIWELGRIRAGLGAWGGQDWGDWEAGLGADWEEWEAGGEVLGLR